MIYLYNFVQSSWFWPIWIKFIVIEHIFCCILVLKWLFSKLKLIILIVALVVSLVIVFLSLILKAWGILYVNLLFNSKTFLFVCELIWLRSLLITKRTWLLLRLLCLFHLICNCLIIDLYLRLNSDIIINIFLNRICTLWNLRFILIFCNLKIFLIIYITLLNYLLLLNWPIRHNIEINCELFVFDRLRITLIQSIRKNWILCGNLSRIIKLIVILVPFPRVFWISSNFSSIVEIIIIQKQPGRCSLHCSSLSEDILMEACSLDQTLVLRHKIISHHIRLTEVPYWRGEWHAYHAICDLIVWISYVFCQIRHTI